MIRIGGCGANLLVSYQWLDDQANAHPPRAKTISILEENALLNSQDASVQSNLSTFYAEDKAPRKSNCPGADSALWLWLPKIQACLPMLRKRMKTLATASAPCNMRSGV